MSARQAKRLAEKRGTERPIGVELDSDAELEEKRAVNVGFAFLADSESDDSDSNSNSDTKNKSCNVKEEEKDEENQEEEVEKSLAAEPDVVTRKKKKQNKKKEKTKCQVDEEKLSVDKILDTLAMETGKLSVDEATSIRNEQEQSLFGVHLGYANADKEMKRILGVKRSIQSSNNKRSTRGTRVMTKKVMLVTPLDEWPRPPTFVGGGIRWTRSNKPKGAGWNGLCNYFEVTWSIAYKKSQKEFELLQRTHDPNLIGRFLQRYPYHIDALLTMSEVFQHHGQMDHAADCIRKCMYVLELAWADQFDVSKGNCRMDIQAKHNAGFFRALFLLMKQVGRRGCMRSAFETAKLLLSMDPQGDPMHVLLVIDYYALTSRQCQFLVDLFDSKTPVIDRTSSSDTVSKKKGGRKATQDVSGIVAMLPNLQFSLALAYFFLGNETKAMNQLAVALLKFPTVLKLLLEKIAVNPSPSSWQPILSSRVFANARNVNGELSVLQHLLDIYVERNYSIWKANDAQSFLLRSAQHVIATPALASITPQVVDLPKCFAKYLGAVAADYSDEITMLPADHPMMQPPLQRREDQPADAEVLAELARVQEDTDAGNLPADTNPLLLFLQTLLPWNRVQGQQQEPPPQ